MEAPRPVRLLGPAEIRDLADRLGVRPTKTLGQNFVHDAGSIRKIVNAADLNAGARVLEVGPGLGSLTLGLLEAGHSVIAIEIDPKLASALPDTVAEFAPAARLEVVPADAMTVRAADLPGELPTALVANLPYNTAVPILLHLLAEVPSIQTALVMVQAEVADRIAAPPGSKVYGVPSAKVAWYGRAWRAGNISRNVFWPVPNVDSALVAFARWGTAISPGSPVVSRASTDGSLPSRNQVFKVIDAAFAQRRKTLRSALAGLFGGAPAAEAALEAAGVDPSARGETLGIKEFTNIASKLVSHSRHSAARSETTKIAESSPCDFAQGDE